MLAPEVVLNGVGRIASASIEEYAVVSSKSRCCRMSPPSGSRGEMTKSQRCSRNTFRLGTSEAITRMHTPCESARSSSSRGGNKRSRCRSFAAIGRFFSVLSGEIQPRLQSAQIEPVTPAPALPSLARGVATMPGPDLTKSGSPTIARSFSTW